MKSFRFNFITLALAGVVSGFGGMGGGFAQQQPGAQQPKPELGAMILMADGRRQRGFVQNSNDKGLLFTLVEGAPGTAYAWDTQVKAVAFDESDEFMREARATFAQGKHEIAAQLLGAVADKYAYVAWVPNSFAAEARYYQIESLRLLGRWEEIGALLQTPAGQAIPTRLPAFFQPQFKLNQLWAQVGAGQLDGVKTAVAALEKPVVGQAKLLPSPSFQDMPLRELIQITFFRARVNEAAGNLDQALADYYRTFSLTFSNQRLLSDISMKSALAIKSRNPGVADGKNPVLLRQIQSLAFLYLNLFGGGEIDEAFAAFAVKPELPKPPAPKEGEEAGKPADVAPAPAAPADAAQKAGEAPKAVPADAAGKESGGEVPKAPADAPKGATK